MPIRRVVPALIPTLRGSVFAFLFAFDVAVAAPAPITFEELLHAENLEGREPQFSPDGRALVLSVQMGAASFPTWGYISAHTRERVHVSMAGGVPREIPNRAEVRYALVHGQAFAPDSTGLLLAASRKGGYSFAHYDLANGRITPLPGRPLNTYAFAWSEGGRILYATVADEGRQWRANAQTLDDVTRRWRAIWESDTPQVTVYSANPAFPETPSKEGALMLADARTGKAVKIGDGDFLTIVVSPGGRFAAAIRTAEPMANTLHCTGRRCELLIFRLDRPGARLLHRYDNLDVSPMDGIAFSPSGDKFLVVGRPKGETGTRLYEVVPMSGKLRELAGKALSFETPRPEKSSLPIGWIDGKPAAIAYRHAPGEIAGQEARDAGCALEYGQCHDVRFDLFVFDSEGRENLSAFAKSSVSNFIAADGGGAFVIADAGLWRIPAGGKGPKRLTAADVAVTSFGIDPRYPTPPARSAYYYKDGVERISVQVLVEGKSKRFVLDLGSGVLSAVDVPGEIAATASDQLTALGKIEDGWVSAYVMNNGGGGRTLISLNEELKDRAVAPFERFVYSHDGKELTGWVLWPPHTTQAKLPAVVSVYGGTVYGAKPPRTVRATESMAFPVYSSQLLAAQGYAVIFPSTPLGPAAESDQPQQLADSVVAAIDALAAKGRIDAGRVGIMGGSFGGYSTAAVLSKRSDRFKAGVSIVGIYDFFHAWGKRSLDWTLSDLPLGTDFAEFVEEGQSRFIKPFWQTPEAYMRNSPIFSVEKLDAPLLMLHGDLDVGTTDLVGAERMYTALLRAGKKPVLVHYWGEGHGSRSASANRDHWKRITKWFGYYLKGEPVRSW